MHCAACGGACHVCQTQRTALPSRPHQPHRVEHLAHRLKFWPPLDIAAGLVSRRRRRGVLQEVYLSALLPQPTGLRRLLHEPPRQLLGCPVHVARRWQLSRHHYGLHCAASIIRSNAWAHRLAGQEELTAQTHPTGSSSCRLHNQRTPHARTRHSELCLLRPPHPPHTPAPGPGRAKQSLMLYMHSGASAVHSAHKVWSITSHQQQQSARLCSAPSAPLLCQRQPPHHQCRLSSLKYALGLVQPHPPQASCVAAVGSASQLDPGPWGAVIIKRLPRPPPRCHPLPPPPFLRPASSPTPST